MNIRKIAESPYIPIICLLDVIVHWSEKLYGAIQSKSAPVDMFSDTNWFEVLVRLVLTYLIWNLYREFRIYKDSVKAEMQRQNAATIEAIRAVLSLSSNADNVLMQLWIEGRDRTGKNNEHIVNALIELGYKGIGINEEHPEITKYKNVSNQLLDEKEEPLLELINNWEENTQIN